MFEIKNPREIQSSFSVISCVCVASSFPKTTNVYLCKKKYIRYTYSKTLNITLNDLEWRIEGSISKDVKYDCFAKSNLFNAKKASPWQIQACIDKMTT